MSVVDLEVHRGCQNVISNAASQRYYKSWFSYVPPSFTMNGSISQHVSKFTSIKGPIVRDISSMLEGQGSWREVGCASVGREGTSPGADDFGERDRLVMRDCRRAAKRLCKNSPLFIPIIVSEVNSTAILHFCNDIFLALFWNIDFIAPRVTASCVWKWKMWILISLLLH